MKHEVIIVGGGPAGAANAMFLLREGIKPLIIERESFPRYHVGESLTGAGGKVLRDLGLEAEMYRRGYPTKQGVNVYGRSPKGSWFVPVMGRDEDWKLFGWDTWQFRRSDFDQMMLDEAVARGATLVRGTGVAPLRADDGAVRGVRAQMADGGQVDLASEVVVDCTGQATWLANQRGVTGPKYVGNYDKQIAIFSQVARAIRNPGTEKDKNRENHRDNTLIFYKDKFHWAWFIPLDDEVVSIGVVIPAQYFIDKKESKRDFYLRELRELHPELARRLPEIELVEDVHVIPNYSYQVKSFTGRGFLCLGDAHRFLDPIFSFGVTVALREAQFAAPVIRDYLNGKGRDKPNPFADYQLFCEQAIDVFEDTLDSFWEHPMSFAVHVHHRYRDDMIEVFAGRIYENQPSAPVDSLRALMGREGQRERSYANDELYSIPIGSRFHPERAPIWEASTAFDSMA